MLALGVGASDTFLSGHLAARAMAQVGYDRATAVAAVGAASTVVWVILTVFFAVNIGVTALVARATGARNRPLAQRAAGQGILLGLASGVTMVALAVPLAALIIRMIGVTGEVAVLATRNVQVLSLAMPATGIASASTAAMRGASDARRPLLVMRRRQRHQRDRILDAHERRAASRYRAVWRGRLGHRRRDGMGAWRLLALFFLTRQHPRAPRLSASALRRRAVACARTQVGLPSGAELAVFQIGVLSFFRAVVALGPAAYAANTSINTVESLGSLPGFGFAVAATALVGQALGAGKPDLAMRAVWAA